MMRFWLSSALMRWKELSRENRGCLTSHTLFSFLRSLPTRDLPLGESPNTKILQSFEHPGQLQKGSPSSQTASTKDTKLQVSLFTLLLPLVLSFPSFPPVPVHFLVWDSWKRQSSEHTDPRRKIHTSCFLTETTDETKGQRNIAPKVRTVTRFLKNRWSLGPKEWRKK